MAAADDRQNRAAAGRAAIDQFEECIEFRRQVKIAITPLFPAL